MTGPSESPDRWQRLWEVFHAALDHEPSGRAAFLEAACGDDPELRREVDELLAAHAADGLLDQPVTPAGEPARPAFRPGDRLASRFRIVRLIGSGGMGTVYEAVDEDLRATVAIKTLHPDMARNAEAIERFRRELLLARRVTHPSACRLFDLFHHHDAAGPVAFLTMELLRGDTLSQRVKETGPLPEDEAYPIVEQMAAALSAAHRVGVIHRDLKSANVVLVPGENGAPTRTVVTDFGLASLTAATTATGSGLTRTGQLLGTPAFMAPEQLEGHPATAATDMYALGLVMYEMVTGEVPFARESALTLAIKRLREPSPPPRTLRPNLRPEWNATIMRCLERDPADRFQTPDAVVDALWRGSSMAGVFIPRRYRRRALLGALALGTAAALVGGVVRFRDPATPAAAALAFNERDWVLVADIENRTGARVLDDTIRFALERELSASQFVNVVPRERVADALRLMRRPEETTVSGEVAREVCLRDGGIRALVRGRVDKLGDAYITAVELVQPSSGVVVASLAEEAQGLDQILPALRRLSNALRTSVGEELARIERTNQQLVHVTTPSLRALQLYSQADVVIANRGGNPGGNAAAEELLKQAIAEDPGFASAYIHLAHAIRNQRRPREEYVGPAARAMELASTVGEGEQQFIRGSFYQLNGDSHRGLASYQALVQLYPDHFWGHNNTAMILSFDLLRGEEAIPYFARSAELRPNDFLQNRNAAWNIAVRGNAPAAARPFIDRARALMTLDLAPALSGPAAWVEVFPSLERRVNGDVQGALEELQRLEQTLATHPARPALSFQIAYAYEAIGRFRDAERLLASPPLSISWLLIAFLRGDRDVGKRLPTSQGLGTLPQTGALGTMILARLGLVDAARTALARVESEATAFPIAPAFAGTLPIVRGELAWAAGRTADTIALIEQGLPTERLIGSPVYFLGCETIANAWLKQGQASRAIAVLEDAHRQHGRTVQGSGAFWLRAVWQLATIYREVGRHADAVKLEAELRQLLAVADADHPILVEMQRRRATASLP